jgi:hypothetical protein
MQSPKESLLALARLFLTVSVTLMAVALAGSLIA